MIEAIIQGMVDNWIIVVVSLIMLIGGTIVAYKKFGLRRVLLGKSNDDRELIYRTPDGKIIWKETLKSWRIILTGGMSLLTLFLIIMILALSFIYAVDMRATRINDELFCREFGTVNPSEQELENYYERRNTGEFIGPIQMRTDES